VGGNLAENITTVISRIVRATGRLRHIFRHRRNSVSVVVNACSTSCANVSTPSLARPSVDDGAVFSSTDRAQLATGRKNAGLRREVLAVLYTTRVDVAQGTLTQPTAGSLNSVFVADTVVAGFVFVAANHVTIFVRGLKAAHTGVDVSGVVADAVVVVGAIGVDVDVQRTLDDPAVGKTSGQRTVQRALAASLEMLYSRRRSRTISDEGLDAGALAVLDVADMAISGVTAGVAKKRRVNVLVSDAAFVG
jgi:hypothetical protein